MKAMIVGGGAREHAIAKRLAEDAEVYAFLSNVNPGIVSMCKDYMIGKETEVDAVSGYASSMGVDIAFIGPEAPLGTGVVDALEEAGVPAVGPKAGAAQLEISKSFMRDLMKEHDVPGAVRYGVFSDIDEASAFIGGLNGRVAVKPVGLTGGKGVKVWGDHFQNAVGAAHYAKQVIDREIGGARSVVIEECLTGEEFTLQAFVDGRNVIPMPLVQDHKRAYEGDRGPNTGGMGSYSMSDGMLPFVPEEDVARAIEIMKRTVEAMAESGNEYKGILYGQFMETIDGPKVIEFNVRFGDPEAMNVLPLLEDSLVDISWQIVEGRLETATFRPKATVCKYVVPKGYGTDPLEGSSLKVNMTETNDLLLFYASVNAGNGFVLTTRSRSLGILGIADSIQDAERYAQEGLSGIDGEFFARHDIGTMETIQRKIDHMARVRKGLD